MDTRRRHARDGSKAGGPASPCLRDFYTDPGFYQLDLDLVFYRDWLFVGHDCELPEPGGFFTPQVGAYPIVVVVRTRARPRFP